MSKETNDKRLIEVAFPPKQTSIDSVHEKNVRHGHISTLYWKVAEAPRDQDAVLTATFDLTELAQMRDNWFVFRDRRPDLYGVLMTLDGRRAL